MESGKGKMDKNSNFPAETLDSSFVQFCLQSLAPLINFPMFSDDKETLKSNGSPCNCSKSGCLKLYCERFAKGRYCIGCNCVNCFNLPHFEEVRGRAVGHIVRRNADAFLESKKLNPGCVCKKTGCKKKYCKCHVNGIKCGEMCRCKDCKNL